MTGRQQCYVANLYLNWVVFAGGFAALLWFERYGLAALWLILTPVLQVAYVRVFPRLSVALGYGSVADEAAAPRPPAPGEVTLYTAVGCPFCPIVERRLRALQPALRFHLTTIDVTARPEILARKGIRAVPVVEAGGRMRVGNLKSRELSDLIGGVAHAG